MNLKIESKNMDNVLDILTLFYLGGGGGGGTYKNISKNKFKLIRYNLIE